MNPGKGIFDNDNRQTWGYIFFSSFKEATSFFRLSRISLAICSPLIIFADNNYTSNILKENRRRGRERPTAANLNVKTRKNVSDLRFLPLLSLFCYCC
jgi:hypothetical protein